MAIVKNFKKVEIALKKRGGVKNITFFTPSKLDASQKVKLLKGSLRHLEFMDFSTKDFEDYADYVKEFLRSKGYTQFLFDASCIYHELNAKELNKLIQLGEDRVSTGSLEDRVLDFIALSDEIIKKHAPTMFNYIYTDLPNLYGSHSILIDDKLFIEVKGELKSLSDFYSLYDIGVKDACVKVESNDGTVFFMNTVPKGNGLCVNVYGQMGSKKDFRRLCSQFDDASKVLPVSKDSVLQAKEVLDTLFKDPYVEERFYSARVLSEIAKEIYEE